MEPLGRARSGEHPSPAKRGSALGDLQAMRDAGLDPAGSAVQHGAWVSLRKGRGTRLGNGVIPARQLAGLRLQSQMAHGRQRGAGRPDQRSPFKVLEGEGTQQHPLEMVPYAPQSGETTLGLELVVAALRSQK